MEAGGKPADLGHGHPVVERRLLGHVAHAAANVQPLADRVQPQHIGLAAVGCDQAQQDLHRRGLARAILTQEAEDGAFGNIERKPIESDLVTISLGQVLDPDCRFHLAASSRVPPRRP